MVQVRAVAVVVVVVVRTAAALPVVMVVQAELRILVVAAAARGTTGLTLLEELEGMQDRPVKIPMGMAVLAVLLELGRQPPTAAVLMT